MVFEKIKNIPWRQIDTSVVILSPKTGKVHELDPVASFIWLNTDGKTTLNECVQMLCSEFSVDELTAKHDAEAFYQELLNYQLVSAVSFT